MVFGSGGVCVVLSSCFEPPSRHFVAAEIRLLKIPQTEQKPGVIIREKSLCGAV